MTTELTRRELYDLVWARPMTKVAADLGISDVGLHKVCTKHRIPIPRRGYWAKIAAGQPPDKAMFHEINDRYLNHVVIAGSPIQSLPPAVAEAHQKAKIAAKARPVQTSSPPSSNEPHPLLEPSRKSAKKTKPGADKFIRLHGPNIISAVVSPESVDRLFSFLDQLVRELETHGYKYEYNKDGAPRLNVNGEMIRLEISEKLNKLPHHPTETELKAVRRWEADSERKKRIGTWISDWGRPRIPEWDHLPSGLLVLEFDKGYHSDGLRRKFTDGKQQRIENMIDQIIIALATLAAAMKSEREATRLRQIQREEEEKRRREFERRQILDAKRWEFLENQIKLLDHARNIELFVKEYTAIYPVDSLPDSCRQLMEWAQHRIRKVQIQIAPDQLSKILDRHHLMDDATNISSWVKIE